MPERYDLDKTACSVQGEARYLRDATDALERLRAEVVRAEAQRQSTDSNAVEDKPGYSAPTPLATPVGYDLERRLDGLRQQENQVSTEIRGIIDRLNQYGIQTHQFLQAREKNDLPATEDAARKHYGRDAKREVERAAAACRGDIYKAQQVLSEINSARRYGVSVHPYSTTPAGSRPIDEAVAALPQSSERSKSYAMDTLIACMRDTGGDAAVSPPSAPSPQLRSSAVPDSQRLADKVRKGQGYQRPEDLNKPDIELPSYYQDMRPGAYSRSDRHGRYVTVDHYR